MTLYEKVMLANVIGPNIHQSGTGTGTVSVPVPTPVQRYRYQYRAAMERSVPVQAKKACTAHV